MDVNLNRGCRCGRGMGRVGPLRSRAHGVDLLGESAHLQGEETEHQEHEHGHCRVGLGESGESESAALPSKSCAMR